MLTHKMRNLKQQTHRRFISLRNHNPGDGFSHSAWPHSLHSNRKDIQQGLKICGVMLMLKICCPHFQLRKTCAPWHSVQKPNYLPSWYTARCGKPAGQQTTGNLGARFLMSCLYHWVTLLLANLKARGPTHSNKLLTGKCVAVGKFCFKFIYLF